MTFSEWFLAGAAIGFKAYFAVLVFALCVFVTIAIIGAIIGAVRGEEYDEDEEDGDE